MIFQNLLTWVVFVSGVAIALTSSLAGDSGIGGKSATAANHSPFELRGILEMDGRLEFSLREVAIGNSFWIGLNSEFRGLKVIAYDASEKALVCKYLGEAVALHLAKDDGIPLKILDYSVSTDEIIEPDDFDPDMEGMQSYHVLRSKLRFNVGSRRPTATSAPARNPSPDRFGRASQLSSEPDTITSESAEDDSEGTVPAPIAEKGTEPGLTENEIIALQAFEKNYVAVREAPKDVEIRYAVAPR